MESKVAKQKLEKVIDNLCAACRKLWPGMEIGGTVIRAMGVASYGSLLLCQSFLQHAGMITTDCMVVDLVARFVALLAKVPIGWLAFGGS
jgi:hypothetical protein